MSSVLASRHNQQLAAFAREADKMMTNQPVSANQLKGFDLVNWLNNKLGDTGELWAGRTTSSVLTREIINELVNCFPALEPHVKLKIIESLPHISPKLLQMWREPLVQLLTVAKDDADSWIRTLASMYVTYPEAGSINFNNDAEDEQFAQTTRDLQKILEDVIPTLGVNIIPPDFHIVSASATSMAFGYSSCDPIQHFKLRKESKSAKLLEDALRAAEAANNPAHRRSAPGAPTTVPVRSRNVIRKVENNLPMRGIPTIPASKISCGFSNEPKKFQRALTKRAGGAVLIDISDIPQPSAGKKQRRASTTTPTAPKPPTDEPPKKRGRKPKAQQSAGESTNESTVESVDSNIGGSFDEHQNETQNVQTTLAPDMNPMMLITPFVHSQTPAFDSSGGLNSFSFI